MSQSVTTTGIAAHITVIDGQPTTTTQDIAEVYGKQHAKVLSIVRQRMAEAPADWCLHNFVETETERPSPLNGAPIKSPIIRMTKKGFHFVVGKFTGAKAVQHQIAFADEFERMEAALQEQAAPALPHTIDANQQQHLQELVQLVVESGKQGYGETWARFHRKFKVPGYKDLPAGRFDEACAYLKGKMDDADMLAMIDRHMAPRLDAAIQSASAIAGAMVQQAVAQLLHRPTRTRMVFGIGYDRSGAAVPIIQPVRDDQCVMSPAEMLQHIQNEPITLAPGEIAKTINRLQDVLVRMATRPALS